MPTVRSYLAVLALIAIGCSSATHTSVPSPSGRDPRVGLKAGIVDAGEAVSGLKVSSETRSPAGADATMNADLAFTGRYAVQGNFNGPVIWDISNPAKPVLVTTINCPASQNDVSVYRNLLFVSVESTGSTVDCQTATMGPADPRRFRGVRIFDIADIRNPKLIANVQTCRGSHTHTLLEDPKDRDNVYIYVSGSSGLRNPAELPGCTTARPDSSGSSLLRIEIIKVPLANPAAAAVVSRANVFAGLRAPATHGQTREDSIANQKRLDSTRAVGGYTANLNIAGIGPIAIPDQWVKQLLDSIVTARGGSGAPTAADSAVLRRDIQRIIDAEVGVDGPQTPGVSPISAFRQCHDITVYPALGIAGGACEGHGLLLDIRDPLNPKRLDAVSDSNFAYWHSATFNNDGTKLLFSDEWGGGGAPKCRATDKKEWGADAIFEIVDNKLVYRSYYKLSAPQTSLENCVAHNGSLIPIPGRDVMVQGWYQGGISVFDFTDASHPKEIAFQDRGPLDATRFTMGGSWSAYWYNGAIISSEIARGLDEFDLVPSEYLTQNEIDAAKTVKLNQLNVQGQPKFDWPPSFPLVKAYLDQIERGKCMPAARIAAVRGAIAAAQSAPGSQQPALLTDLANQLESDKRSSCDAPRVTKMQRALRDLARPVVP